MRYFSLLSITTVSLAPLTHAQNFTSAIDGVFQNSGVTITVTSPDGTVDPPGNANASGWATDSTNGFAFDSNWASEYGTNTTYTRGVANGATTVITFSSAAPTGTLFGIRDFDSVADPITFSTPLTLFDNGLSVYHDNNPILSYNYDGSTGVLDPIAWPGYNQIQPTVLFDVSGLTSFSFVNESSDNVSFSFLEPVPEPSSLALLGFSGFALLLRRKR